MSLGAAHHDDRVTAPDIAEWHSLDKSRFFVLGAGLFSGVSAALYPAVVLKTRQQVSHGHLSCLNLSLSILRLEGVKGFYRGFGTSLLGSVPARALYMGALEVTKSVVGPTAIGFGCSEATATAVANAAAGVSSAVAAQLVWTPVDVVSQKLMVQGTTSINNNTCRYMNGVDAFKKILYRDGPRGLYRGFGISLLTYAPSNAVWWASYSLASGLLRPRNGDGDGGVGVQVVCAGIASGLSALVTMPLDTVKTRVQILEDGKNKIGGGRRRALTVVRGLVREGGGGIGACYRGLGPRWVSMSFSAATMVTTYEFLKRLSTKSYP